MKSLLTHSNLSARPLLSCALVAASLLIATSAAADGIRDRIYLRSVGALHLSTALASSDEVVLSNVTGPASLAVDNGPIPGSGASVKPVTVWPSASVGFIVKRWGERYSLAVETVLAPPPVVIQLESTGTLAEQSLAASALGIPTGVPALGPELGQSEALPPMVTAVFRPLAHLPVQPYIGAGLSYLLITKTTITNPILTEVAQPEVQVENGFNNIGFVAQAGVEAKLWTWNDMDLYVNVDLKYMANLEVTATVVNAQVRAPGLPLYEVVQVGNATASVAVNPLIVQTGLGVNF